MENSTNKCSYEGCTEESDRKDGKGKCVFHSNRPNKTDDFDNAFWKRYSVIEPKENSEGRIFDFLKEKDKREKDTLDFKGFVFPNKFLKEHEAFLFCEVAFKKKVVFEETIFEGNSDFSGSKFFSDISFKGAEFFGNVCFDKTTFSNKSNVNFIAVTFSNKGDVSFTEAEFSNRGSVTFNGAKFSNEGKVDFTGATFFNKGDLDFTFANFANKGETSFLSKFSNEGNVKFSFAKFTNEGNLEFSFATFNNKGDVDFSRAKFSNKGNLNFLGICIFENKGGIDFSRATFSCERVLFHWLKMTCKNIDFTEAKAHTRLIFEGEESSPLFSDIDKISFKDMLLDSGYLQFRHVDLSRASFLYTDVRNLLFENVTWHEKQLFSIGKLGIGKRQAIYDEDTYDKDLIEPSFKNTSEDRSRKTDTSEFQHVPRGLKKGRQETVSNLYKQLRINYERNLNFSEYAGDFHIGEMEMKKRLAWNSSFPDWILLFLHKHIGVYGERWWLPIIWLFFLGLIFSWFVPVANFPFVEWTNYYWDWNRLVDYSHFRTSGLTLLQLTDDSDVEYTKSILGLAERFVSIVLMASLVLGIQRKLSRTQPKG